MRGYSPLIVSPIISWQLAAQLWLGLTKEMTQQMPKMMKQPSQISLTQLSPIYCFGNCYFYWELIFTACSLLAFSFSSENAWHMSTVSSLHAFCVKYYWKLSLRSTTITSPSWSWPHSNLPSFSSHLGIPWTTFSAHLCNTIIYSCLCGSLQESVQEGKGEIRYHFRQTQF